MREGLAHFTKNENACNNIQALVVFSRIEKLHLDDEFRQGANAWVNVTDIEHIGEELDTIKAKTRLGKAIVITSEDIFEFIRLKGLDERYILTKYSDTNLMPADLFHDDEAHNGDDFSPNVLLAKERAENEKYKQGVHEAVILLQTMMEKMKKMADEKDIIIQQQKAELLQIKAEQLAAASLQIKNNTKTNLELETETVQFIEEVKAVEKEVEDIKSKPNTVEESKTQVSKKRFGLKRKILKSFNVDKESMDDEQLDLIGDTIDKSMIVAGCAGSGKSVIAMYKAQQILDLKGDVILIAFTKSLICRIT